MRRRRAMAAASEVAHDEVTSRSGSWPKSSSWNFSSMEPVVNASQLELEALTPTVTRNAPRGRLSIAKGSGLCGRATSTEVEV